MTTIKDFIEDFISSHGKDLPTVTYAYVWNFISNNEASLIEKNIIKIEEKCINKGRLILDAKSLKQLLLTQLYSRTKSIRNFVNNTPDICYSKAYTFIKKNLTDLAKSNIVTVINKENGKQTILVSNFEALKKEIEA